VAVEPLTSARPSPRSWPCPGEPLARCRPQITPAVLPVPRLTWSPSLSLYSHTYARSQSVERESYRLMYLCVGYGCTQKSIRWAQLHVTVWRNWDADVIESCWSIHHANDIRLCREIDFRLLCPAPRVDAMMRVWRLTWRLSVCRVHQT